MEAGKLRHTITIKRPPNPADPSNRNEYGELDATWSDVVTVRASMEPLLGNEYFAAEGAQSKVEAKFRMRYRAGIDDTMRVLHSGVEYEILSAINVQSINRELLLYVKKVI